MIRLHDLTVTRGTARIVTGLNAEIRPGRIFWVVGPNGAGKTSLLRVIAGLDPPRAGRVTRAGPPLRYFQSEMALPAAATVAGWERLVRRLGRSERIDDRTALWPDVSGGRRIDRLSTGQRKRLLLDALLRQPGGLILDEPFEHLSPEAKAALRSLLEHRASERVVIVATNQHTARAGREGGLHLEGGVASIMGRSHAMPTPSGPVPARSAGRVRRALALARFAITVNARRWLTRGGLLAGLGIMAIGPLLSAQRGLGWSFDRELGFSGFFVMALFALRSGFEEHRELGLAAFLHHNFVSPVEHGLGLLVGLLGSWAGLCSLTFGAVLLLGAGDAGLAGWSAGAWGLRLLVVLGFVPLVEMIATLRLPLVLPALGYFGLAIALTLVLPEEQALALFIPVEPGQTGQLVRLARQGAACFAITASLFLLLIALGPSLSARLPRPRLRSD